MSSGEKDLQKLSAVSSRLLLTMKQRGRLPMLNLSAYARSALTESTGAPTSCSNLPCQCQTQLKSKEQESARKRARIFSNYSDEDLSYLDKFGIKIIGVYFDIDHTDRSWAD